MTLKAPDICTDHEQAIYDTGFAAGYEQALADLKRQNDPAQDYRLELKLLGSTLELWQDTKHIWSWRTCLDSNPDTQSARLINNKIYRELSAALSMAWYLGRKDLLAPAEPPKDEL